jgi:hypothetical protein
MLAFLSDPLLPITIVCTIHHRIVLLAMLDENDQALMM